MKWLGKKIYDEANYEDEMEFSVCNGICWELRLVAVGFRDEVVVADAVTFWVGGVGLL